MVASGMASRILAVVPARFASTRFPGKIIAPLFGKPLVLYAYQRALQASLVDEAVIATDDDHVVQALAPYGVPVIMTRTDHASGTDRIAEVAANTSAEIIVNIQGDEPLIDPGTIDAAIRPLLDAPDVVMATARHRIREFECISDPNVVKVVCDTQGHALYFSRSPIPFIRDTADREASANVYWQHIGLYVYRRSFLPRFAGMPQTPLEKLEKLEQLRVLENGYTIAVVDTEYEGTGVDVPEDLEKVQAIMASLKEEV